MRLALRFFLVSGVIFLLSACERNRLDEEVDRLCRLDGGISVYERVPLPNEMFDKRGLVFPNYVGLPEDKGRYGPDFFVTSERRVIVAGNPEMYRTHIKVIRRSDGKLLGEDVRYTRRGGDLPGPWHPSHHSCAHVTEAPDVVYRIFVRE
jgi:hypothetical protein